MIGYISQELDYNKKFQHTQKRNILIKRKVIIKEYSNTSSPKYLNNISSQNYSTGNYLIPTFQITIVKKSKKLFREGAHIQWKKC